MTDLAQLIDRIAGFDGPAWRRAPMPSTEDEACAALVRGLAALPPDERDRQAAPVRTAKLTRKVEVFARRMAALAVRTGSAERLRDGALALALNGCVARETYMMLSLIHHSAAKLGLDGDAVLREAARHATPEGARKVLEYAARDGKSIATMGWREIDGPDGFDYGR